MDNKLTIKTVFNPDRDTAKAKRAADKLIDIVKQNHWSINVGGKSDHLMYEAWQTVGKYFNVTVATKEAMDIEIGGVLGFKAIGYAIDNRTGLEVGHAEAYCMRDEGNWKAKPTFQLASMAQTRAGSKALRQMFGFVVALAGYSPTPAEEMTGDEYTQTERPTETQTERPSTAKQIGFILRLLDEKGFTEEDLKKKYKVESVGDLTLEQASLIIENLLKMGSVQKQELAEAPEVAQEVPEEENIAPEDIPF